MNFFKILKYCLKFSHQVIRVEQSSDQTKADKVVICPMLVDKLIFFSLKTTQESSDNKAARLVPMSAHTDIMANKLAATQPYIKALSFQRLEKRI